jgi:hypothetical protein
MNTHLDGGGGLSLCWSAIIRYSISIQSKAYFASIFEAGTEGVPEIPVIESFLQLKIKIVKTSKQQYESTL